MFTHEINIIQGFFRGSSAHIHIYSAVFLEILVNISGVKMIFFSPPWTTVAYILDQSRDLDITGLILDIFASE